MKHYFNEVFDVPDFSALSEDTPKHLLTKIQFVSIGQIPDCTKYKYPDFEDLQFYCEGSEDAFNVVYLDGEDVLKAMEEEAFNICPIRWDRVKSYISSGKVAYPEVQRNQEIMNGRHRTLALMKIYKNKKIPFICPIND